ncbi:nucleoside deaminase [Lederbergia galactosidilytica]|uniref:Guanine deaminase n=1 Tax=Lederbergia galactosidilytica TaxID=217031 RepID=A0A0Q9YEC5_9BACI|nr:nucleoside deaminase [Lederbergia galactosidilytica]KRG14200.1 guanine deaminase [Virgibacillus soli]KRG16242.1 guanine deaminase [Lederbergia galactosidilytica]MBP1916987.1 tRNA(Arg) A34 adenosine deaminase TadA [Lederbergia galactosidilytica]OAK67458.1 guanine deaminase [Lederbergia galactosidilytica]
MDIFMNRAVELARENVKDGGQPFGAVLVRDGKIITEGVNELHLHYDSSGHAELLAIRRAQEQLKTLDLKDCTIYASGEPCPMCLTAIYFSGIQKVYYCETVEEAKTVGLGTSSFIYKELALPKQQRSVKMEQMPIEEGETPLTLWSRSIK